MSLGDLGERPAAVAAQGKEGDERNLFAEMPRFAERAATRDAAIPD